MPKFHLSDLTMVPNDAPMGDLPETDVNEFTVQVMRVGGFQESSNALVCLDRESSEHMIDEDTTLAEKLMEHLSENGNKIVEVRCHRYNPAGHLEVWLWGDNRFLVYAGESMQAALAIWCSQDTMRDYLRWSDLGA